MKNLFIDIETYSSVPIGDCGHYRYAQSPDFEILLVAYAIDHEPTKLIDLTREELPRWFIFALTDPSVTKYAHNATFERVCFTMWMRRHDLIRRDAWLNPEQWVCSSVMAARCGLPLSLKQVGEALHLTEKKMDEGKKLIQLFCTPRKTSVSDNLFGELPERVQPEEHPEQWETFREYCIRDVDVERAIVKECAWNVEGDFERNLYAIDQRINDRGVLIDLQMANEAIRMDAMHSARLSSEAAVLTGLSNPNSKTQLKGWLENELGIEVPAISKESRPELMKAAEGKPRVQRVLQINAELSKASNAKYDTMLDVAGPDDRARGLTQFYGTRTGRWSGRLLQLQNLPQNHIETLDQARLMVKDGDWQSIDLCYGNIPDTLSQLIRTTLIAPEGKTFAVCDFSAIEARVLAWMAGEDWVLEVFRNGGDIYCATASQMFHVPVEKHGRNAELRQKGKVAVLALGYQGGVGALDKMGGARMGMTQEEEQETVKMWRAANRNIVSFWGDVERAAKECIVYKTTRVVERPYMRLTFTMQDNGTMTVTLPSGRMICYPEASVPKTWKPTGHVNTPIIGGEQKAFDVYRKEPGNQIRFRGMNQTTRKWEWIETYGGKITENITQAIGRDCLAETMTRCDSAGFPIVFHIHDELVMEVPAETQEIQLQNIEKIFAITPEWAEHLPLKGAGYLTPYYKKD